MDALTQAIEIVGSQAKLARVLQKKPAHVWNWLNRDGKVPAEMVIPIEVATRGKVTRSMLRPDLYPAE